MKPYNFKWKTVRENCSVQFHGKITVLAESFEEALNKAETTVRNKHPMFENVLIKFTEEHEDETKH